MRKRLLLIAVCVAALLAAAAPGLADAATIVVNSTADGSVPGQCTLRDAISSAAFDSGSAACISGDHDDTITFAVPAGATITLSEGELVLPAAVEGQNIDIQGPGADQLTISAGGASRVFHIGHSTLGAEEAISGLTIADGYVAEAEGRPSDGGGILNEGALTLTGVVVEDNQAAEISRSVALADGGGVANTWTGTLTLARSTVVGNTAEARSTEEIGYANGGGIYNQGTLTVADSTVADNSAITLDGIGQLASGGGMATISATRVTSSTIVGNTVISNFLRRSANLYVYGSEIEVENTLIAEPDGATNCSSPVVSLGFNLEDEDSCGFHQSTDQPSTDPELAASGLADNGGPTPTIALEPGSPALDQGLASAGETTDQRGLPRPVVLPGLTAPAGGDHADIGAFEQQLPKHEEPEEPTHSDGGEPADGGGAQPGGGGQPSHGDASTPPAPAPTPKLTVAIRRLHAKPGARRRTIRFRANLPGASFECALGGAQPSPCTSPYRTRKLTAGRHAFSVRAIVDGQRSKPARVSFTVR